MEVHGSSIPVSPAPTQPVPNRAPEPTIRYSWQERHPDTRIIYIRDHRQANEALGRLNNGPYGFDLEWKPNFVKGRADNRVALVQIANHETILLLQVTAMQQFPSKLHEFLLNPNITKAGVGIQGDAMKLYKDWNVDLKNCVDLTLLARTVDNEQWKGRYTDPLGLARLVAVYENRALAKGRVTRSNWEAMLTVAQQIYAANDAHAGYVIYTRLMAMLPNVSPPPEASCYTFDTTNGLLCVPFGKRAWKASNPDYNPGPPPPPREPKLPKPNKQAMGSPEAVSNQTYFPVVRGPGSVLPAPQSIPSFPGSRSSYGHRGSRTFRGSMLPPPNMQSRSRQLPSQNNSRYTYLPGNVPHHPDNISILSPFHSYDGPPHPWSSSSACELQDTSPRTNNDA